MTRKLDHRVWFLLLTVAVGLVVACSSSSSTGSGSEPDASEDAPASSTKG